MCGKLKSDCCEVNLTNYKGLPCKLLAKIASWYEGCEGEMLATCFCSKCGKPMCISCMN